VLRADLVVAVGSDQKQKLSLLLEQQMLNQVEG